MNSSVAPVAQCPAHATEFDPFDLADPFASYARLRAEEPIFYDPRLDYWIVSKYADIKAIFDNWAAFSSENTQRPLRPVCEAAKAVLAAGGFTAYSGLSGRIPPDHTRIRKAAMAAFTPKRYRALAPFIRRKTIEMLDALAAQAQPDFVAGLAFDLPAITIMALLGVPEERVRDVKRWAQSRVTMTWGNPSDEEQVALAHELVAYWKYCREVVAERHAHPADDLPGDLVAQQLRGEPIDDHEIASFCYSLLIAGHETTTNFIANALVELTKDRGLWATLAADHAKIPAAIEEVLRMSPSVITWRRRTLRPVTVAGTELPAGANVLLLLGSANRDEAVFTDGERFDLERPNARNHLSFGYGIHYCLGALLAKMQMQIVLEELLARFPDIRLAPDAHIEYLPNAAFRGPRALLVAGL